MKTPAQRKADQRARDKAAGLVRVEIKTRPDGGEKIRCYAKALEQAADNKTKTTGEMSMKEFERLIDELKKEAADFERIAQQNRELIQALRQGANSRPTT